jgi:hypothetical protein
MKYLLYIALFSTSIANCQQKITLTVGRAQFTKATATIPPLDSGYRAFGFIENTSPSLLTQPTRLTYFCRVGANHLDSGYAKYINYDVASRSWGSWQTYDDPPMPDHRDTWGGRLDDSIIVFGQQTWNGLDGQSARSLDIYYYKIAVSNFGISSKRSIFTGNPTIEQLFRGEVFGHTSSGDAEGEYYIMLFQWDSLSTRFKVDCLHTTDNFQHITALTVVDESNQWSEGVVQYLGNGKLVAFLRNDQGGKIDVSYSSNYGSTWSFPQTSNLGYYGLGVKIPYCYKYKGKYDIIFQDRDAGTIQISRDNDTSVFFNNRLNFNLPEVWVQNSSTTTLGNASLGYPSMVAVDTTNNIFMNCWAHEDANSRASIRYTVSKINVSKGQPDAPPLLRSSYITSTGFRIDMMNLTNSLEAGGSGLGYTEAQMENISYFLCDVATDASFTTFPTIRWGYVIDAASSVHNLRVPATWLSLNDLTPNTTYYVRIKAVNFNGESSYTTTSVTTLP